MDTLRNSILFLTFWIIYLSSTAQTKELGVNVSPNFTSASVVDTESSLMRGSNHIALTGGINYSRTFNAKMGVRLGLNFGWIPSNFDINLGSSENGVNQYSINNLFYNSISVESLIRFPINNAYIEILGGADLRYFYQSTHSFYRINLIETSKLAFSTFVFETSAFGREFQSNLYFGLNYVKALTKTRQVSIGLAKNFGLSKIAPGTFTAYSVDGSSFTSRYRSVTDFVGLKFQYSYNLKNKKRDFKVDTVKTRDRLRKALFIELLGNGGTASLNYDMRLKQGNKGLGFRAGVGVGEFFPNTIKKFDRYISLPLAVNYIFGQKRSGFETGIGITPEIAFTKLHDDPQIKSLSFINAGYRFQPLNEGLLFRIAWTPYFRNGVSTSEWFGVSLGYSFK